MIRTRESRASVLAVSMMLAASPAMAEDAPPAARPAPAEDGEIIVTARKRDETSIAVPVALTAVSGAELTRRGVASIDGMARLVPQLVIGEGGGTVQGGNIALRGISGADANPFADQAVSFNVDGVQVARASVRRMAEMDLQQIEVLKGPQALFFGKNSPGGVISIRTADPTDKWEGKASVGYEFNAHEWRGDGYISGPLTPTLGARIAVYGSKIRGWTRNTVPDDALLNPGDDYAPKSKEYAIRGTLKWEPTDSFDARLKFTYGHIKGQSSTSNVQFVYCPTGQPQSGIPDNCKADDHVSVGSLGTEFGKREAQYGDGKPYLHQTQMLGGLEMNYHPTDTLTVTSVTGFYKVHLRNLANYTGTWNPASILASRNRMDIREISEELRLTSDFDGIFNFMIGGHYQDSKAKAGSVTAFNALTPIFINGYLLQQKGQAWSVFGQAMVDVLPNLELSAGGRYSHETKKLPSVLLQTSLGGAFNEVEPPEDNGSWHNFSPEVTLSYRPTSELTVYGSYKRGFLSGGFNSGSANFTRSLKYNQQTVRGFEGGIKAALLDGALRTNLALYTYKVNGLQVQVTTEGTIQELKNAGKVSSKGVEFDASYRTPIQGLSLHGALTYSKGRYDEFIASCYRGLPSPVCSLRLNPVTGQTALSQDLSGTELIRSPKWAGNAGFSFEQPVGSAVKIGLSGDMTYSHSYLTDSTSNPNGRSPSYTLFDATIRLADIDDAWEIALIGRNLTDKYYWTRNSDAPFTGVAPGGTGTLRADVLSSISRGRELMVRMTTKF